MGDLWLLTAFRPEIEVCHVCGSSVGAGKHIGARLYCRTCYERACEEGRL